MRRVALSAALLVLFAAIVTTGPREAEATAAIPPPELEQWASGTPIPKEVRLWEYEGGKRTKRGPKTVRLDGSVRRLLARLAKAHRTNDPVPFGEALQHPSPYVNAAAVIGIPQGRVASGTEVYLDIWEHARREDVVFVRGFVPDLIKIARAPRARAFASAYGDTSRLAVLSLAYIVPHMEPGELRGEACDAAVESFLDSEHPLEAAGLLRMRRAAPDVSLSPAHRKALAERLHAALDAGFPDDPALRQREPVVRATNLVHFLPWLQDPALTERYARIPGVPWPVGWMTAVLETGDPTGNQLVREWFENPGKKDDGRGMPGGLATHATGEWLPAMRSWLAKQEPQGPDDGAAEVLRAIGTSESIEVLRSACVRVIERGKAPSLRAAGIWLQVDPGASDAIRSRIQALPAQARVALLGAMGGSGVPGMLPPVLSYLDVRGASKRLRCEALRALGQVLTRVHGQEPVRRKAVLARVRSLLRRDPHARRCVPEGLRFADRELPADFEAVLLESLAWGARDGLSDTHYLIRMLGMFGGAASLKALQPFCAYSQDWGTPRAYGSWHLVARQAVGHIEHRLANPPQQLILPGPTRVGGLIERR